MGYLGIETFEELRMVADKNGFGRFFNNFHKEFLWNDRWNKRGPEWMVTIMQWWNEKLEKPEFKSHSTFEYVLFYYFKKDLVKVLKSKKGKRLVV